MERAIHHGTSPYEAMYGFCRAVRMRDTVWVAGTAPVPPPGEPVPTGAHAQMLRCGDIIEDALHELGATVADVVRTRMYITDAGDADEVGTAHREIFGTASPVATMVVVAALLDPLWRVEVEVEAVIGSP